VITKDGEKIGRFRLRLRAQDSTSVGEAKKLPLSWTLLWDVTRETHLELNLPKGQKLTFVMVGQGSKDFEYPQAAVLPAREMKDVGKGAIDVTPERYRHRK